MPVTMELSETHLLIRLEGAVNVAFAEELRRLLLEWLATGKDLQLDLEGTEEIDITVMQLLWAAGREAARAGVGTTGRVSEVARTAAREAGFEQFPGLWTDTMGEPFAGEQLAAAVKRARG